MKLWNPAVAGLALALPSSLPAQTVASNDLVGSWVQASRFIVSPDSQYTREWIWTFRADSTWAVRSRTDGVEDHGTKINGMSTGRWDLRGDRFWVFDSAGHKRMGPGQKVVRKGTLLLWLSDLDACADTLRPVDTTKSLPPPSLPPTTIDPAALAGTWVSVDTASAAGRRVIKTDTLKLLADSTAEYNRFSDDPTLSVKQTSETGRWRLLPGNLLFTDFKGAGYSVDKATLQDQQLTLRYDCSHEPQVYKRAGP